MVVSVTMVLPNDRLIGQLQTISQYILYTIDTNCTCQMW